MQELKFEDLSLRQKLGMTYIAFTNIINRTPDEDEFILNLIKEHSLGAVWVSPGRDSSWELINKIRETADYPILIFTDAENGMAPYTIGRHNAIACTGSEESAYIFGKTNDNHEHQHQNHKGHRTESRHRRCGAKHSLSALKAVVNGEYMA